MITQILIALEWRTYQLHFTNKTLSMIHNQKLFVTIRSYFDRYFN